MIRFASYNLLDFGASTDPGDKVRYERIFEVIRKINPDLIAVQEVVADDDEATALGVSKAELAAFRVQQLAEATGMRCEYEPNKVAVAVGNHRYHPALLWKEGITPAGSWFASTDTSLWHAIGLLNFDIGGTIVRHATFHAAPFGRHRRTDESEHIFRAMKRNGLPGLIGADWNSVSADRVQHQGRWVYYDEDPFRNVPWSARFVHSVDITYDDQGRRQWTADRLPGEILYSAGLTDAAAALRAPTQQTFGYWKPDDAPRRVDVIRVTGAVLPALRSYHVADSELARSASDHLPVVVDYDPAAIQAD